MGKVKQKVAMYGKMYGNTLPTFEKMENVSIVTDIIATAYKTGVSDGEKHNNRLEELEQIATGEYDTPGAFQNWLVDSIRKAYLAGYGEKSKEK